MSKKTRISASALADEAVASYHFGDGVTPVGGVVWDGLNTGQALTGSIRCQFDTLNRVEELIVQVDFDAAGHMLSVSVIEPVLGSRIGRPGELPDGQAAPGPDFLPEGLWHDSDGRLWRIGSAEPVSLDDFSVDAANADDPWSLGQWRLPTTGELVALYRDIDTDSVAGLSEALAQTLQAGCVWSGERSQPRHVFCVSPAEPGLALEHETDCRHRVVLVHAANETGSGVVRGEALLKAVRQSLSVEGNRVIVQSRGGGNRLHGKLVPDERAGAGGRVLALGSYENSGSFEPPLGLNEFPMVHAGRADDPVDAAFWQRLLDALAESICEDRHLRWIVGWAERFLIQCREDGEIVDHVVARSAEAAEADFRAEEARAADSGLDYVDELAELAVNSVPAAVSAALDVPWTSDRQIDEIVKTLLNG